MGSSEAVPETARLLMLCIYLAYRVVPDRNDVDGFDEV